MVRVHHRHKIEICFLAIWKLFVLLLLSLHRFQFSYYALFYLFCKTSVLIISASRLLASVILSMTPAPCFPQPLLYLCWLQHPWSVSSVASTLIFHRHNKNHTHGMCYSQHILIILVKSCDQNFKVSLFNIWMARLIKIFTLLLSYDQKLITKVEWFLIFSKFFNF